MSRWFYYYCHDCSHDMQDVESEGINGSTAYVAATMMDLWACRNIFVIAYKESHIGITIDGQYGQLLSFMEEHENHNVSIRSEGETFKLKSRLKYFIIENRRRE